VFYLSEFVLICFLGEKIMKRLNQKTQKDINLMTCQKIKKG